MNKKIITAAIAAALIPASSWALTVDNTAGNLETAVTDLTITELTITGTIDVRDFSFINENLDALTSVDLSDASIAQYTTSSSESYFGLRGTFEANTIPANSFFGMSLTSVVLPSDITAIGERAFSGCTGITAIDIPSTVETIGDAAFYATGLTEVEIAATTIGDNAFTYCTALTGVTIDSSVESIGASAFAGCSALTTVTISADSQLTTIGDEAFAQTQISEFDFTNCPNATNLGIWVFAGAPISIASLPADLIEVPEGIFFGNAASDSITLPETLTTINSYAYYGNSALTQMTIPALVTYIGNNAFEGDTALVDVIAYPTEVPELGEDVFLGVNTDDDKANLWVDENVIADYQAAAQWEEFYIQDISTLSVENPTIDQVDINAYFIDKTLHLQASEIITLATVTDETGITVAYRDNNQTSIDIDTGAFGGHVYIVKASLADGSVATLKLLRK